MILKLGICVAYDWRYLEQSIPPIYSYCDSICLSLDKNRRSWSGGVFSFDEARFKQLLDKLDVNKKIRIYEDDFYSLEKSPSENELHQRNQMAAYLGSADWHLQLDADEYIINPGELYTLLEKWKNVDYPINIRAVWATLFKKLEEGYLLISDRSLTREYFPLATNLPAYSYGRNSGHRNIYTNVIALHQSWARSEEDIWLKLNSWGHSRDVDREKFFYFWKSLSITNYKHAHNFNPIKPSKWHRLSYFSFIEMEEGHVERIFRVPASFLRFLNWKPTAKARYVLDRLIPF